MKSKKASLELSVTAVIVIIIAIAMLGAALYFIQNVFGGATQQLKNALSGIDEQRIQSFKDSCEDNVCGESSIEIKKGQKGTLLFAINNRFDCEIDEPITGSGLGAEISQEGECQTIDTDSCEGIDINVLQNQRVDPGQKVIIPVVVSTKSTAKPGIYRYAIAVNGHCSEDESIQIDQTEYFDVYVES